MVKEDDENTDEDIKEDEVEEKLIERSITPQGSRKNDIVLQWCVKDCEKPETKSALQQDRK